MQTITKSAHEKTYTSIPDAFMKILKYEGPKALFKGAACRMMVCPPLLFNEFLPLFQVMAPLFGIAQTVYYIGVAEKVFGLEKSAHV